MAPLTEPARAVEEVWNEIVTGSISEREGHTAICHCDALNHRMIVFGGGMGIRNYNDVWAFDLEAGSERWYRIDALGTPPTEREDHTAIYDAANQRMIVFGGKDNWTGPLNDLWALDLSTPELEAWRPITATGTSVPPARWSASAIYDPIYRRMIVFGGMTNQGGADWEGMFRDVWSLDLRTPGAETWTKLQPGGTSPPARRDHTAIYDPGDPAVIGDERMIVWGGSSFATDVYALDLSTPGAESWSTLTVSGTPPTPRDGHSAIYDPIYRRMVIFGGAWANNGLNDVATLTLVPGAENWRLLEPSGDPPDARREHTALYDPFNHRMIVFGGDGGVGPIPPSDATSDTWSQLGQGPLSAGPAGQGTFLNDVWQLGLIQNFETWALIGPFGPPVSPRMGHTAICHCTGDVQRMIVFGGGTGGVWSLPLNVTPYIWFELHPAGSGPHNMQDHTAIYDAANERMIVFGGSEAWALNLSVGHESWETLNPSGLKPPGRWGHSAVYDSDRQQMVVFGGGTIPELRNDVWALDLSTPGSESWREITPPPTPPAPRTHHSAVYDRVNERMVIFGGTSPSLARVNDVWALDLSTPGSESWTRLAEPPNTVIIRNKAPGVYYYRVKATSTEGDSPYSNIQAVIVSIAALASSSEEGVEHVGLLQVPPAPVLNPISNPDGDGTYEVSWERSPGALFYTLEEDGTPFFTTPTVYLPGPGGTLPAPRSDHAAIYDEFDPSRPRMVMFGGAPGPGQLNDVWELSLVPGEEMWRELTPIGDPPSARSGHSAICHCVGDYHRMVIFGGEGGNLKNDTWTLDLAPAPPGWSRLPLVPLGPPPPARTRHSAIYDAALQRMIVFGGLNDQDEYLNDVWGLNLITGSEGWQELSPSGTPPTPRAGHSAVYDAIGRRMIVFGGENGVESFNEVWALNLIPGRLAWTELTPSGTPPAVRSDHTVVNDPGGGWMIVFGGRLSTLKYNDVWLLVLTPGSESWAPLGPVGIPPAGTWPSDRSGHAAVRDAANGRMIVFGGETNPFLNDTWSLDLSGGGGGWTELAPAGTLPPTRTLHSAIYDDPNGRMIVFGGQSDGTWLDDVWTIDLTAGAETWTKIAPAGHEIAPGKVITPEARSGHTAIYDAAHERMILFGGADDLHARNDVWALDLTAGAEAWTLMGPWNAPIPARTGHTAVYDGQDPDHPRIVVFGGAPATVGAPPGDLLDRVAAEGTFELTGAQTVFNDVWALGLEAGTEGWHRLYPAGTPPVPRMFHSAIIDEPHHRMIVFGGADRWQAFGDLWSLDLTPGGEEWTELTPTGPAPEPRLGHSAVYDAIHEQMVLFAGIDNLGVLRSDAWALDLSTPGLESWRPITPSLTTVMFSVSRRELGTYYYRVRGVNVEATGPWSNVRSTVVSTTTPSPLTIASLGDFARAPSSVESPLVPPPPPAPMLFEIFNPDGDGSYVISWSDVLTATGYTLQEDNNPDFFTPISVDLTTGTPPGPRTWHTAFMDAPNNRMFVFGGSGGSHVHLNDLWALTLEPGAESWTRVTLQGEPPPIRLGHTTILDGPNERAVTFGGKTYREDPRAQARLNDTWAVYPDQWLWSRVRPLNDPPGERQWHTAVYDAVNQRMVVFGGDGPQRPDDGFRLDGETVKEPDDSVWILALPAAPVAPSGLMTTAVGATQVDLAWTDNSVNETQFRVQRSPNGETAWQEIAALAADTTTFSDTSVICGHTYFYRILVYRATSRQFSKPSNVVSATPTCPATLLVSPAKLGFAFPRNGGNPSPKSVTVSNAGGSTLTWQAEVSTPWLSVTPGDGVAPSTVAVQVDASSLNVETYTTSITVRSIGSPALRSPQTVDVTVCPAWKEDVVVNGEVDVEDVMAVALAWRCKTGCSNDYDVDDDGDVDIVDLMQVIGKWGAVCGD